MILIKFTHARLMKINDSTLILTLFYTENLYDLKNETATNNFLLH